MQRKDIDQNEFDDLRSSMHDTKVEVGDVITTINGTHPVYGGLILISAMGTCAVLGNDVHLIVGENETLEDDVAIGEAA